MGLPTLALMCPSAEQYQDLIVERFKQVAELGFNGLAIDKVTDYGLCYDYSHGHRPAEAFSKGIIETLKRVSDSCRKYDPEFLILCRSVSALPVAVCQHRLFQVEGLGSFTNLQIHISRDYDHFMCRSV